MLYHYSREKIEELEDRLYDALYIDYSDEFEDLIDGHGWADLIEFMLRGDYIFIQEVNGQLLTAKPHDIVFNYRDREVFVPYLTFDTELVKVRRDVAERYSDKTNTTIEYAGKTLNKDGELEDRYECTAELRYNYSIYKHILDRYGVEEEVHFTLMNSDNTFNISTEAVKKSLQTPTYLPLQRLVDGYKECHREGYASEQEDAISMSHGTYSKWENRRRGDLELPKYKGSFEDILTSDVVYHKRNKFSVQGKSIRTYRQAITLFEAYLYDVVSSGNSVDNPEVDKQLKRLGTLSKGVENRSVKIEIPTGQPFYIQHYHMFKPINLRRKTFERYKTPDHLTK